MNRGWTVHGERPAYTSEWVSLHLADVEKPSGTRQPHHVVRLPHAGAGAVVVDEHDEVLLIWRHRFIPDRWGWELPAGRVDPGEDPAQAAVREVAEETGWDVRDVRHLCSMHTTPGLADQISHVFLARADHHDGAPREQDEGPTHDGGQPATSPGSPAPVRSPTRSPSPACSGTSRSTGQP